MMLMELPPDPVVRALVQRYARLLARRGEEMGDRPLVLPTGDFFPDAFEPDERSLKRLVKRMRKHAGMADIPVKARLVQDEHDEHDHGGGCGSGGCGSGACSTGDEGADATARLVDDGDGWRLNVTAQELKHPVVLTCNVARALAYVFLMETQRGDEPIDEPLELTVDLTAVALGFGELLLEGSYIYQKSCGGPSIGKVTALGPVELAIPTALFVAIHRHSARKLSAELPTTQKEAFAEARALADSNPALVERLRHDPAGVAEGGFELGEAKPLLSRLFAKRKKAPEELSLDELEALVATRSQGLGSEAKASDPKRDELRALVEEALTEARADAE
jgi:hypothetical protein